MRKTKAFQPVPSIYLIDFTLGDHLWRIVKEGYDGVFLIYGYFTNFEDVLEIVNHLNRDYQ